MTEPHGDIGRPIHTMPVNDVIEHTADDGCFCGPTPDPVHRDDGSIGWVMVHHSVDGREFTEPDYTGQPMPQDPRPTTAPVELVIDVPNEWWMNANHRTSWRVRHARTKWLRHLAATLARQAHLPTALATPVRVEAWVTYPRGGKNDPNNATPTTKALIDGLTDYGCWPDDDQHHVQGPDHRYGGVTPGRRTIRLVITPGGTP